MRLMAIGLIALSLVAALPAFAGSLLCVRAIRIEQLGSFQPTFKLLADQGFSLADRPLCAAARLSGPIEKGDAAGLEKLVQANLPMLNSLQLNSNGGDLAEAMQLGRIARRYSLTTEAPTAFNGQNPVFLSSAEIAPVTGAMCASACFFVWLGGIQRDGNVLGIHRQFPPADEMRKLSPTEADAMYRALSRTILAYLSEVNAAPHWLEDMMKIASDDLYMIPEETISTEFAPAPDYGAIPSFAQWRFAVCGGLIPEESKDLYALGSAALARTLPKAMEGYYHYLDRILQETIVCEHSAVMISRWKLRTPTNSN